MSSDGPIVRDEFNQAMQSFREQITGLKTDTAARFSELKVDLADRFARQEAFQENASRSALVDAEERGRMKQQIADIQSREKGRDHRADRLSVGLILTIVSLAVGLVMRLAHLVGG